MVQPDTRSCPECGGTAKRDEGMDTTYTCEDCDTRFMDNPRWKERFGL